MISGGVNLTHMLFLEGSSAGPVAHAQEGPLCMTLVSGLLFSLQGIDPLF